jgi:peptide/nickel transport system substrate-binding protein/microcin C transport system substrate-binding protein
MTVLPKYFFDDPKKKYETLIGSGPYKFTEYNRGKNILITRNDKWWGFHVEPYKNYFHFPKIYFRFVPEDNLRLEMLKKGDLDVVNPLSPESFQIKAQGDPWGRTVFKKQVENLLPVETEHIAWNLKNPLFANRDVRLALAHLMNREMMNEKFLYNMDRLSTGPWYQKNPYADPTVKPISFDPKLAQELLKKAGFSDADHSGILKKVIDGKKVEFRFTLVFVRRELERFLTVYKEDLKKVGIELNLKIVDWTTFTKSLDERKFEAVAFGWSGGAIDVDPSGLWHSDATRPGGLNFISYMNQDVDKNIDLARAEMDSDKRQVLLNKVYRQIAEDAPYLFMFEQRYLMYAHSKRIHIDHPVFPYSLGEETWRFE